MYDVLVRLNSGKTEQILVRPYEEHFSVKISSELHVLVKKRFALKCFIVTILRKELLMKTFSETTIVCGVPP